MKQLQIVRAVEKKIASGTERPLAVSEVAKKFGLTREDVYLLLNVSYKAKGEKR